MGVILTRSGAVGTGSGTSGTSGTSGISGTSGTSGAGDGRAGTYNIPISVSDFTVTFSPPLTGNYSVAGSMVNTVDPSASLYDYIVTSKGISAFQIELTGDTDSSNYQFDWIVTRDGIAPSADNVYSLDEKLAIEMEMEFIAAKANYYQEFFYTGNALTSAGIWEDSGKASKLFGKALSYSGNKLVQTVLTRVSDGTTLTKDFTYTGNQLATKTVTVSA